MNSEFETIFAHFIIVTAGSLSFFQTYSYATACTLLRPTPYFFSETFVLYPSSFRRRKIFLARLRSARSTIPPNGIGWDWEPYATTSKN